VIQKILSEIAKHEGPDAKLWEHPGIAPRGYSDLCAGQSIFPVYGPDGITGKVAFSIHDPRFPRRTGMAFEVNGGEDVSAVVSKAFANFRSAVTNGRKNG
jgi:hypothetical protein